MPGNGVLLATWLPPALSVTAVLAVLMWPTPRRGKTGYGANADANVDSGSDGDVHESVTLMRRWLTRAHLPRRRPDVREEVRLLDGIASALEAGLPTEQALTVVLDAQPSSTPGESAAWEELRRAAREGQPLAPAWARLARRTRNPTVESVARAWAVASSTGAPLAAAARASASAARERHRLHRAIQIATAGARATALVLSLLPVAGIGLAAMVGIGPAALYDSPIALASAGLGLVLLAAGQVVVRRLVAGVSKGVT